MPSVGNEKTECYAVKTEEVWYEPIRRYLLTDNCNEKDEQLIRAKSARFMLMGTYLYRRGYLRPLLKCVTNGKSCIKEYVGFTQEQEVRLLKYSGRDTTGQSCKLTVPNTPKSERCQ